MGGTPGRLLAHLSPWDAAHLFQRWLWQSQVVRTGPTLRHRIYLQHRLSLAFQCGSIFFLDLRHLPPRTERYHATAIAFCGRHTATPHARWACLASPHHKLAMVEESSLSYLRAYHNAAYPLPPAGATRTIKPDTLPPAPTFPASHAPDDITRIPAPGWLPHHLHAHARPSYRYLTPHLPQRTLAFLSQHGVTSVPAHFPHYLPVEYERVGTWFSVQRRYTPAATHRLKEDVVSDHHYIASPTWTWFGSWLAPGGAVRTPLPARRLCAAARHGLTLFAGRILVGPSQALPGAPLPTSLNLRLLVAAATTHTPTL